MSPSFCGAGCSAFWETCTKSNKAAYMRGWWNSTYNSRVRSLRSALLSRLQLLSYRRWLSLYCPSLQLNNDSTITFSIFSIHKDLNFFGLILYIFRYWGYYGFPHWNWFRLVIFINNIIHNSKLQLRKAIMYLILPLQVIWNSVLHPLV